MLTVWLPESVATKPIDTVVAVLRVKVNDLLPDPFMAALPTKFAGVVGAAISGMFVPIAATL